MILVVAMLSNVIVHKPDLPHVSVTWEPLSSKCLRWCYETSYEAYAVRGVYEAEQFKHFSQRHAIAAKIVFSTKKREGLPLLSLNPCVILPGIYTGVIKTKEHAQISSEMFFMGLRSLGWKLF